MIGIFANCLWTTVLGKRILNIMNHVIFPAKIQISRCIRVYVWFKDNKHVIWVWISLILKNISLLDSIWSLRLVGFAHSPASFIFWLDRLIFSISINSHPDNIYLSIPALLCVVSLVSMSTFRDPNGFLIVHVYVPSSMLLKSQIKSMLIYPSTLISSL